MKSILLTNIHNHPHLQNLIENDEKSLIIPYKKVESKSLQLPNDILKESHQHKTIIQGTQPHITDNFSKFNVSDERKKRYMKLNNFDRALIASLLISTVVKIFSDSLRAIFQNAFSTIQTSVFSLTAVLILIWMVIFIGRYIIDKITAGKYAVELLILNENNELLLYNHPVHKKQIPPGGRVNSNETPDEAVKNRLQERLGLTSQDYEYHALFHNIRNVSSVNIERVFRVPAPFLVQKEKRRQRGYVKYHYDFFYVLKLTNPNPNFLDNEYGPPIWVNLEELKRLIERDKIFPDVLDAYESILFRLQTQENHDHQS